MGRGEAKKVIPARLSAANMLQSQGDVQPCRPRRARHATQCDGSDALRRAAAEALRRSIRAGADAYERRRDLPRLTRLDPREIAGETVGNAETIVARLKRALRAERNRADRVTGPMTSIATSLSAKPMWPSWSASA